MTPARDRSYAAAVTATTPRPGTRGGGGERLAVDAAIATGLAVLLVIGTDLASHHRPTGRAFDAGTVAILLVAAGSLTWRRRHPEAVLAVVFAATLGYGLLDYASGPIWVALIVAYVTAILEGRRLAAIVAACAGFGVFSWLGHAVNGAPPPSPTFLAALASWLLVLFGAAEAVRIRRQRIAEAARIRDEEARRRASEERLSIARDLHDVLAHNISAIHVQAGVALHLNEELPEQARAALTAIRRASGDALGELRSVLDVLRRTGETAPRGPAPGLDRLDELLAPARAAGLEVDVVVQGERRSTPAGVDLAAYRIAQEALTNVIRHARATRVRIGVTYAPQQITLRIEDDGRGVPANADRQGNGILGMRERAAALGGELEAGPRPEGGFRVVARLRLEAAR